MQTTLLSSPKCAGRTLAATSAASLSHPSRLFYISDHATGSRFLVDTGAAVSVVPPSRTERLHQRQDINLQAVNNTKIATYGMRSVSLELGLRRTFRWVFVIANVKKPILGADFLHHFNLLVDMRHYRLLDGLTNLTVQGTATREPRLSPKLQSCQPENKFTALLRDFPSVTQVSSSEQPVQHAVTHHIKTNGPPVSARARCLAPERLKVARQEFQHMMDLAPLQARGHPHSTWSPIKPQGIGAHVVTTGHSIAAQSLIAIPYRISKTSQRPFLVQQSSVRLIWFALITKSQWNQRMSPKLQSLRPLVSSSFFVCHLVCETQHSRSKDLWTKSYAVSTVATQTIDDILIASATPEEHLEHVRQVLERLACLSTLTSAYLECHPWTS